MIIGERTKGSFNVLGKQQVEKIETTHVMLLKIKFVLTDEEEVCAH